MDMLLFFRTIWRTSCRTLRRRSAASLIALLLVGWSSAANAFWALGMVPGVYIPQSYYKHGAVYTRAIVLSQAGNPYYVEYDSSGNEGREIAEKTGQYERAQIVAGTYYRSQLQRLADSKERYPEHEELTAAAYRSSSFTTAAGETIQKPSISPAALTVLVRAQNNRYLKDGSDLLLLELPIKASVQPSASSQSILLSEAGDILHQTANTIAFRVGFFGKDGKVETSKRRDFDSQIYGKMPNVVVSMGGFTPGGIAATDENGKYSMNYFLPPCPGFTFEYTTPVYLELYYSRFNPRGNSMMPYYLVRQDYDFCNGLSALSMWATLAMTTSATFIKPKFDFPVDLMVVDGAASFANVKLDAKTAYNPETSDYAKTLQSTYDFDGDEKPEIIVPGKKVKKEIDGKEREVFVETAVAEAELQGIYLSSRHSAKPASTEDTAPDFTRLIDTTADFKDRGMLQSITSEDLRDTDIYVFRESTGQLVAERRGLHENELYKNYSGVDDKQGSFRFTIQLRGSAENTYALSGRNGEANFNKWQSAGGFTEEFQKRTANHLKSGEQVRIIAINRPTGYMGSTRINLNASLNGNMIDLNQARIQLTPPNLKIWAERKNKIEQGMTRGEEKKQLIGNEGAGLGSDISIAIYSDWRDQDGGPLPEALADYGYTGRLAKIVAANQLAPVGANNLSQFKIKPGQQVQVIQLPEKVLAKQHLYLQVAGQPENRNPDFATGNGQGILKYRPSKYVPVQVPLHDEQASEIARQAYRKADKEKPELNLKKPEPMYSWQYRPEMQFSLYELNVNQLRKDEDNNKELVRLDKAVLTSSTDALDVLYSLLQSEFSQLTPIDINGQREVVFALGGQEVKASIGADRTVTFKDLDHIAAMEPNDFLSLRLYTNNDVANILWEWAFDYVLLLPMQLSAGETVKISADVAASTAQGLSATVLNPKGREGSGRYSVGWSVKGNGVLEKTADTNTLGHFANSVRLPTRSKEKVSVIAAFKEPYILDLETTTFEIIPGQPHEIQTTINGRTAIAGAGAITVSIDAKDKFGNPVQDGTSIEMQADDIVLVDGPLATQGGKAKVVVKGYKEAGEKKLLIKIGNVIKEQIVTVDDINLMIEAPSVVSRGTSTPVIIRAESDTLDLSGVRVQLTSLRGAIAAGDLTLGSDNTARATFESGDFIGPGKLIARINDKLTSAEITVKPLANDLKVSNPLLVSTRFGSPDSSQGFSPDTDIILSGTPGELVEIDLRDYLNPNLLPMAFWGLYSPDSDGRYRDDEFKQEIIAKQVESVGQGVRKEDRYLHFTDSAGALELPYTSGMSRTDNVGLTVSIKPESDAFGKSLLNFSASGLQVDLTAEGKVRVKAQLENSEAVLLSQALTTGKWHRLGVHVINRSLILQVDDQVFSLDLGDSLKGTSGAKALVVGLGYQGGLNQLGLYDWSLSPVLTLASSGAERGSATVGTDGQARFRLTSNFSTLLALRENPNKGMLVTVSDILIAHAVAADDDTACSMVPASGVLGAAEAMLDFIVKCELQKKVRQAEIKVKTAQGVWQTTVAYAELGLMKGLQAQISQVGSTAIFVGQCLDGVVTGSTDNAAGTICDFVASMLLVGDLRDFVIHSYYFYTDNYEKFDQATYVFAGLGIVGTLAEFTGVGVTVDAALAGGKTAAKVLKGSAIISNMVAYLDRKVLNGVPGQRVAALKYAIPLLQLVALVAYEGEEIKGFVTSAVKSVDDFEVWVRYTYWMVEEGGLVAGNRAVDAYIDSIVSLLINTAYAGAVGKVDDLLAILKQVQAQARKGSANSEAGQVFTRVIKELESIKGTELANMAKKSDELAALMAIHFHAPDKGLQAFRNTPCTPPICYNNKSMAEFIKDIGKLDEHVAAQGQNAAGFNKVFEQLGTFSDKSDGYQVGAMFVARGGAGTLLIAKKFMEMASASKKVVIEAFEEGVQTVAGIRHYDLRVKVGGVIYRIESKYWSEARAEFNIKNSVNVYRKNNGEDGAPGQLMKDVLGYLTGQGAGKNVRWEFVEDIDREKLAAAALKAIKDEKRLSDYVRKAAGVGKFSDIEEALEAALKVVLGGVKDAA